MKIIAIAVALLASSAYAATVSQENVFSAGPLTISDETAESFIDIFSVLPDGNGNRFFSTSDRSLVVRCFQGLRPVCGFDGPRRGSILRVVDDAAEEFSSVVALKNMGAYEYFKSPDGKLLITCFRGFRPACAISVK